MEKLRCAIIGCGRIGCGFDDIKRDTILTHAGSYFSNPKTKLVALCDIDSTKLEKYGKKYDVTSLYTNSIEMLKNEKLDCLSICTLVDSHLQLVKEASNYNIKAIFLEKPISSTLDDAKKIINICKEKNIVLIIDHKRRFDPFYHSLKKLIKDGKLVKIQLVNAYYGAGISNTGSHVFDIIRFLFGEVNSVSGTFSINKSINPYDPNINVILELNDFKCTLESLDSKFYGLLEMDIFGTKGRLRFNLENYEIYYSKVSTANIVVYNNLVDSKLQIRKSHKSNIQLGVQNLVDCLVLNKKPYCTGEDGYKSLELIIASTLSANKLKRITLPLKNSYKIYSK